MNPIDTHCHLQFKSYDEDREEVAKRNSEELEALINVGTSLEASEKGILLSEKYPNFFASVGIHPHHVNQWTDKTPAQLKKLSQNKKVVAVGEIGLDNHLYKGYPEPNLMEQSKIFQEQISIALEQGLPILFHCRDAYDELFDEIKQYQGKLKGLMHCFMGSKEQAKKFLDLDLYISFAGNITYKGTGWIREMARFVPEEKILIETDSPFLPPEPYRGRRNEPIYVKIVAKALTELKSLTLEEVVNLTAANAKKLLGIQ